MFVWNYAESVPELCSPTHTQAKIIAPVVFVFEACPLQFLEGFAKVGEVGHVFRFHVFGDFLLDVSCRPEVLLTMKVRRLEEF